MTTKKNNEKSRGALLSGFIQAVLVVIFLGTAVGIYVYLSSLEMGMEGQVHETGMELAVETIPVEPKSHRLRFNATGTVQVRGETAIVPQVSGRVAAISDNAFPGGAFGADTILFTIEKIDYELALETSKAEVAGARTRLTMQKADAATAVAEWRQMHPDQSVPPLVAKKPQLKEAKAALTAARARLKTARLNLTRTDYTLPFSGRITAFDMEVGQYVVAGQPYGRAYRLDALEIHVPLREQELDWLLSASDPVIKISTDFETAAVYRATVKRIAGRLDPMTRFSRVVLELEATGPSLLPNTFVYARFIGPRKDNVWILPLDALQEENRLWAVTPEKTLQSVTPEIIQITGEHVMAAGDGETIRVVRGRLPEATEGTAVRLRDAKETKTGDHDTTF